MTAHHILPPDTFAPREGDLTAAEALWTGLFGVTEIGSATLRAGILVTGSGTVLLVQAGSAEGSYDVLTPGCGGEFLTLIPTEEGGFAEVAYHAALHALEDLGGIAWAAGPAALVEAAHKAEAAWDGGSGRE